ncbi:hypothetical protein B0T22DRAFT_295657 [Podospora appendiculata]|uniref:Uncharacterized protein n=1 Tax=Podospora appendiculata TaxID=314037 RepID=A0AAE0X276_9PEZI|nr:hypothetical protein B0T22DRAFT_295657 [Podospora appendiculata]
MNSIARSATLVALLGFQDHALVFGGKDGKDSEVGDFPVLAAVFRDLYPIVRSPDIPLSQSATRALEECRRTQDTLMQLLDSMGFTNHKHSDKLLDRISYSVRRYFKHRTLEKAKADYRNSVFLLRDITMDAITHYHLQHMRRELDEFRGGSDHANINSTPGLPPTPTPSVVVVKRIPSPDRKVHENWVKADKSMLRFMATARIPTTPGSKDKGTDAGDTRYVAMRGLYDTGSERNIISRRFLNKHGVLDELSRKLPRAQTFRGVGTMQMKVELEAPLDWYPDANSDDVSRDTFFVMDDDNDDFDILLGWDWICDNEVLAFKSPRRQNRVRRTMLSSNKTVPERKRDVRALEREAMEEEEDPNDQALHIYQQRKARQGQVAPGSMSTPGSTATTALNSPESPTGRFPTPVRKFTHLEPASPSSATFESTPKPTPVVG